MSDLSTPYLGFVLSNPLVVAASPITRDLDLVRRAEDAGASAFVMHSLFEEQIEFESLDLNENLELGAESNAESASYFPDMRTYNTGPEGYLDQLRKIKKAVKVPVFGSLNGTSVGGWVEYARLMEEAGADGIELNVYDIPTDPRMSSEQIERNLIHLVKAVVSQIRVPLAVKLSSFFTAPVNLLQQLHEAGVGAAVLFNRFYQPDFDIDNLDVVPHLRFSHSEELLVRLHWCGVIYGRVPMELAVTGGAHTARDVVKCMMAGANVVMLASALMRHGPAHISHLLTDIRHWMAEHEYTSIRQMQGAMSFKKVANPQAYERGNYMRVLRRS
ncbi:MAG: dihydroorotate dehydrogenase-like protein [Gemmataceae bacterium]